MIRGKNIDFDIDSSIIEKKVMYMQYFHGGEGGWAEKKGVSLAFVWDVCDTLSDQKCGQKVVINCTFNAFCSG
jgi:hypothetical protein